MIVSSLFTDHMVLQREKPIRIFGTGAGRVKITFLGEEREVVCRGGDWETEFPASPAGGPYEMTFAFDDRTVTVTDVMIGEVFLAGGQSNMQMGLGSSVPPRDGIEDQPLVRYFQTNRPERGSTSLGEYWTVATKDKVRGMSAVAWHAAIRLAKELGVAVGIVTAFQGAAILQSFIRRDLYDASPVSRIFSQRYGQYMVSYPVWSYPGMLYDFQIRRLSPLSVRAVMWYQGEANADPTEVTIFTEQMRLLMQSFREAFRDPALRFVQVQLAPHGLRGYNTTRGREMQWKASEEIEDLAIITIGDVGDHDDIHPPRKEQVGERMYRAILHTVFGRTEVPYLGPVMQTCTYAGNRVTVTFTHTEGGLTTDGEIDNLYLIDKAGEKQLASCRIEGETLVAEANIEEAVGVEFGMEPYNEMHLFNGETLPAVEFSHRK